MQLVPIAEALQLARSGAMKTAPCALAVLLCESRLIDFDQHHSTPNNRLET